MEASETQIAVQFITKLQDPYKVPETSIVRLRNLFVTFNPVYLDNHANDRCSVMQTVPASVTRYGLSQIVNHLLNLDKIVPFEFLVDDTVLCTTLETHLSNQETTAEKVLEVEYFPALLPPTPRTEYSHDDWISCISVVNSDGDDSILASGGYDGVVKFWNNAGEIGSYTAHDCPIKACAVIPDRRQILTGSDSGSTYIWSYSSDGPVGEDKVEILANLSGHESTVEAASVRSDGERCATAGWDKNILIWKCGDGLMADVPEKGPRSKKKKGAGSQSFHQMINDAPVVDPVGSLDAHTQAVSNLKWVTKDQLVSCSWDHSIKIWDVEMETVIDSFTHNKVIYCVDMAPRGHQDVVAFGGIEKSVRLWDRREKKDSFAKSSQILSSHTSCVSDLKWHPTSEHHIMTASFDGSVKIWDIRAQIPLHTMESPVGSEDDKVMCCTWIGTSMLSFGGTNKILSTMTIDSVI
jgi:ribosome biogenesis protein YTM1